MASPPKPWERAGAATTSVTAPTATTTTSSLPAAITNATALTAPTSTSLTAITADPITTPVIPPRPDSLATTVNQNASAYSRLGSSPYGSSYSSPYSRLGGYGSSMYGSSMYGGVGGYGSSMYGGMGGMYGSMYGGMPGMNPNGDGTNGNSLTSRFGNSTQATFQMLEGIVGAFGGFAQMLESTYMATHSSFFAMVAVADQFGNLRDTLGNLFGIFTLMRWIRTLMAKITGRPPPVDAVALTPAAFAKFEGRNAGQAGANQLKPSRKPLIFFILAAFGLPYLMNKVIKSVAAANKEDEERRRMDVSAATTTLPDPSQLEFCRVLYDYMPQDPSGAGPDLAVKRGDFIAVLGKTDPNGVPSEWWRCRARDGRVGWLPSTFLEVAKRSGVAMPAPAMPQGKGMEDAGQAPTLEGKAGDVSVESFQKSQFYQ